jgi:hypothetical protein
MLRAATSDRFPAAPAAAARSLQIHRILAVTGALAVAALAAAAAGAADFGPLFGNVTVKAGANPEKTRTAIVGTVTESDNELVGSIDVVTARLMAERFGGSRLTFSGLATSVTNAPAPPGQFNATAQVSFVQSFTTAAPQWLVFSAKIDSPPADPGVFASLNVTRAGQPVFSAGHTAGSTVAQSGLRPAGTYNLQGNIFSSASVPGTHTGLLDASVLIAALADFNGNTMVDGGDLGTWRTGFGSLSGTFASGNLDGDADTDGADFLLWQNQLGTHAMVAASHATPEPAAAALAAIGMLAAFAHCRTRRCAARRPSASPAR